MRKINNFGHFESHKMNIFLQSPVFKIKGFGQNFTGLRIVFSVASALLKRLRTQSLNQ